MDYFNTLQTGLYNDYLMGTPKKAEVIKNAKVDGIAVILPNSNNRALKIFGGLNKVYLQSYDTLILKVEYVADGVHIKAKITKLWNGYSVTTLKHVNEFMKAYTGAINTFNKKEWEAFDTMTI